MIGGRRALGILAVALGLVAACSSGDAEDSSLARVLSESAADDQEPPPAEDEALDDTAAPDEEPPEEPPEEAAPPAVPRRDDDSLRCTEAGFPCAWGDAAPEVLEASLELGDEAWDRYESGTPLVEIALTLVEDAAERGVGLADLLVDEDALMFRLDGGRPIWLLGETSVPPPGTIQGLRAAPISRAAAAPVVAPAAAPPPAAPAGVVGDDPTSKSALVLSPFAWDFGDFDEGAQVAALYESARGYEGNVTFLANTGDRRDLVGTSAWRNWDQYDVVHVATHGTQLCDADRCTTVLSTGRTGITATILAEGEAGTSIVYSYAGRSRGVNDDFFELQYPNGIGETVVVMSACLTGAGDLLTGVFGDGVMFGWDEIVPSDVASRSSIALHSLLIDWGTTTALAHGLLGSLATTELQMPGRRPLTQYVLDESGQLVRMPMGDVVDLGGGEPPPDVELPEILRPPRAEPETVVSNFVRRQAGQMDLRVREVAWLEDPDTAGPLAPGTQVQLRNGEDGPELPVRLRVDGIEPGTEADTSVRLRIDGVLVGEWPLLDGIPTDRWSEWVITDQVPVPFPDNDEIELHMLVDLPEGGVSEHRVGPLVLDCLVGTWRLRSDEFLNDVMAMGGAEGFANITTVDGQYILRLDRDGSMLSVRDGWTWRASTPMGDSFVRIDASVTGTWSATADTIEIVDEGGATEVSTWVEIDGQRMALPGGSIGMAGQDEGFAGVAGYVCDARTLAISSDGFTSRFDRIG